MLGFLSAQFLCLGFTSSVWIAFRLLPTSVTRSSLVSFSVSVRAPVYLFTGISVTPSPPDLHTPHMCTNLFSTRGLTHSIY